MKRGAPEEEINDEPFLLLKVGEDEKGEAICAKVSVEDHAKLSQGTWHVYKYVVGKIDGEEWRLNRYVKIVLQGDVSDMKVDHQNRNRLDNRRSNLRFSTDKDNSKNRSKTENATSKFWGVHFCARDQNWLAYGYAEKKTYLGTFSTEEEAAIVYDRYTMRFSKSRLNFPSKLPEYEPFFAPSEKKEQGGLVGVAKRGKRFQSQLYIDRKLVFKFTGDNAEECAMKRDEYIVANKLRHKMSFPERFPDFVLENPVQIQFHEFDELSCYYESQGHKVIIDKDDASWIKYCYPYVFCEKGVLTCKVTQPGDTIRILARLIMKETDPKVFIDHFNKNRLDHRKSNLRRTDAQGNAENRKKRKDGDYILPYGVAQAKDRGGFLAFVTLADDKMHTMTFQTVTEAAIYRDIYLRCHFPTSLRPLNFEWTPETEDYWKKAYGFL